MKKIFIVSLLISMTLVGCGQPATQTQEQASVSSTLVTAAQTKAANDNTIMSDMLAGKLNDKTAEVTGTVFISETNNIGDQTLTTIQIYPDPDNTKQIITAYFTLPLTTEIKINDNVKITGVCKGKLDLDGMDISAVKLLGESVEKL